MNQESSLRFVVITTQEGVAALEGDWRALYAATPDAHTVLSWEWMSTWMGLFGPRYIRRPHVMVWQRGGTTEAILPLYRSRGRIPLLDRLRFFSTGEDPSERIYPEYLDVLCPPSRRDAFRGEGIPLLLQSSFPVQVLELPLAAPDSLLARCVEELGRGGGWTVSAQHHDSFAVTMTEGFEGYIASLSANARQQFRRLLRAADESGVTLTLAPTAEVAVSYLEGLITLHTKRWNGVGLPGVWGSPTFAAFHRTLLPRLVPTGELVIARIAKEETPIAFLYGFLRNGAFDFYQSGIVLDGSAPIKSPGMTAHLLLMRELTSRSVLTRYDLLAGGAEYKERLAPKGRTELVEYSLARGGARQANVVKGLLKRAVRALRSQQR